MLKTRRKYYSSCEFLPLWNFFKLNNGEQQNLKYLLVLPDRLDYDKAVMEEPEVLEKLWGVIFEEYNKLEKNFGALNFINDKSKILYFYSLYLQEQAILKSLLYRTNVGYIRLLRMRGYNIANTSHEAYWQSLKDGLNKVEEHITYIQILKHKIKDIKQESSKESNPFDATMAWIASNGIEAKEDITVTRYIKIKEIILQRIKAKQVEQSKSRLHGR